MRLQDEVKRDLVKQWLAKAEEDFAVADIYWPPKQVLGYHRFSCSASGGKIFQGFFGATSNRIS